jgi:hypothetical protein
VKHRGAGRKDTLGLPCAYGVVSPPRGDPPLGARAKAHQHGVYRVSGFPLHALLDFCLGEAVSADRTRVDQGETLPVLGDGVVPLGYQLKLVAASDASGDGSPLLMSDPNERPRALFGQNIHAKGRVRAHGLPGPVLHPPGLKGRLGRRRAAA